MKHVLILIICTLLSGGILCASTNSVPANPVAQPAIASDGALSITFQQLQAAGPGQGAPMPICPPNNPNCGLGLQAAGTEAPMPVCAPGYNCQIQQETSPMAL
jgi:hypothetical protein